MSTPCVQVVGDIGSVSAGGDMPVLWIGGAGAKVQLLGSIIIVIIVIIY